MVKFKARAVAAICAIAGVIAPMTASAQPAQAVPTHSGDGIIILGTKGFNRCTLTGVASSPSGKYGVTAGHCFANIGEPKMVTTMYAERLSGNLAGSRIIHKNNGNVLGAASGQPVNDFAMFPLARGVVDNGRIQSRPQTGIKPLDDGLRAITAPMSTNLPKGSTLDVSAVRPGQTVCKAGAVTGRTCGPVVTVNTKTNEITAMVPSIPGDSGSPMYVVGRDGKAHIVGNLSGGSLVVYKLYDGVKEHTVKHGVRL